MGCTTKGRPFTFLDHALKCGDSLVGADEEMYRKWAYSQKSAQFTLYLTTLEELVSTTRQKRKELESFAVLDVRDAEHKVQLLKEADYAMARVKLGCDLLVGVRLLGLKQGEQEELLAHLLWDYVAGEPMDTLDAQRALHAARKECAFHWPFEFPEVLSTEGKGGFSAFVGNPPFLGGTKISTLFGSNYLYYLQNQYPTFVSRCDLCVLFFIRSHQILETNGTLGFVSTNTISQGDSREAGLDYLVRNCKVTIYRATSSTKWPGQATVFISIVFLSKGNYRGEKHLNDRVVDSIGPTLEDFDTTWNPQRLQANIGRSYTGSKLDGTGFILGEDEAKSLVAQNSINQDVVLPYLSGQDLYSTPNHQATRWVICFWEWDIERAQKYVEPFEIVELRIKQGRQNHSEEHARSHWWLFQRIRSELYGSIRELGKVLVRPRVSNTHALVFIKSGVIISEANAIFLFNSFSYFAILQSTLHELWAYKFGSTLGQGIRYTPSDVFDTYPMPIKTSSMEGVGKTYYEYREQAVIESNEGLTVAYTRFHNPKEKAADITHLRNLHVEMDNAVAAAYGWSDLDLGHSFHETPQGVRFTISEQARKEILNRLLDLNQERFEEEVKAGLHKDKKGKKKEASTPKSRARKPIQPEAQIEFFDDIAPAPMQDADVQEHQPGPTPVDQIGSWDQCVCLGCGKHLVGFSVAEHTKSVHQGRNPGYRKAGR